MTLSPGFAIAAMLSAGLGATGGGAPPTAPPTPAERIHTARSLEWRNELVAAAAAWEAIAADLAPGTPERIEALEGAGRVWRDRLHRPVQALGWWEAAWSERRQQGRLGGPDAWYPTWVLSSFYEASERWADAEQLARERLLAIGDAEAGDRVRAAERLAGLIQRQRPDDPELFELAELEVASATDEDALASALANRARRHRASGRLEEALVDLERAGELDGDDPWLLGSWADTLVEAGRLGDAAAVAEQALARAEARYGARHPELYEELARLVDIYAAAGRWDDTRAALARAREVAERAHGPGSEKATKTREARRELERRVASDAPPSDQPLLGCRCTCQRAEPDDASKLLTAGDIVGAQRLLEERVRTAGAEHGADSDQVVAALEHLATRFERLDLRVATAARERCASILARRHGRHHPEVLRIAGRLAADWNLLGGHARSEAHREAVVDGLLAANRPTAELATAVSLLAESRERGGRHAEALALRARAVEVSHSTFGPASPEHRSHRIALAAALARSEKSAEAVELLRDLDAELAGATDPEAQVDRLVVVATLRPLFAFLGHGGEADALAALEAALLRALE